MIMESGMIMEPLLASRGAWHTCLHTRIGTVDLTALSTWEAIPVTYWHFRNPREVLPYNKSKLPPR